MRDTPAQKRRVIIAIPAYDCTAHLETIGAIIVAGQELQKAGIEWGLIYQGGSSIISTARNALVHTFLSLPEATDLVFIDSDISFKAEELLKLIAWGAHQDIVAGAYRIKQDELKYSVHPILGGKNDDEMTFDQSRLLVEAEGVATGFLLIKRHVFETMQPDMLTYNDRELGKVSAFFHFDIDEKEGKYVGEDIYFCKKAKKAGFKIWLDPSMWLSHVGLKHFSGRLADSFHAIEKDEDEKIKEIA